MLIPYTKEALINFCLPQHYRNERLKNYQDSKIILNEESFFKAFSFLLNNHCKNENFKSAIDKLFKNFDSKYLGMFENENKLESKEQINTNHHHFLDSNSTLFEIQTLLKKKKKVLNKNINHINSNLFGNLISLMIKKFISY